MLYDNNFDFKYAGFWLSAYSLESCVNDAIHCKQKLGLQNHSTYMADSIISCIASQSFDFDKDNKRVFKALYKMLRDYANDNGVYSDEARAAMRTLCVHCGFAPDSIVLTNQTGRFGRFGRFKQKIGKWFGLKEPHDVQEDKIDQLFNAVAQQNSLAKQDILDVEAEKRRAEEAERKRVEEEKRKRIIAEQEQIKKAQENLVAPEKPKKTKWTRFAKIGATITGFIALGAAMLFNAHDSSKTDNSVQSNDKAPTFKTVNTARSAHYNNVITYNMADSLQKQKSNLDSVLQYRKTANAQTLQKSGTTKQTVASSESQAKAEAVTRASRSALNVLIGTKRAQKLCDNIQSKVDAGIFKLPDGMSVERVAHAIQMSRIYEGHSVILDALNSDKPLTVEEQRAFDEHIASIGDLGVKLQKRMATKHKLSKHSRYNNSQKTLKIAHIKNLKQLKQITNRAR